MMLRCQKLDENLEKSKALRQLLKTENEKVKAKNEKLLSAHHHL